LPPRAPGTNKRADHARGTEPETTESWDRAGDSKADRKQSERQQRPRRQRWSRDDKTGGAAFEGGKERPHARKLGAGD
jgi:hypothetical protein